MSADEPDSDLKIWKLLSAVLVTLTLFVVAPFALAHLELMSPLNAKAGWILGLTAVGMVLKILLGDLASGEFQYYKHGYDFCTVAMGAYISSAALQLLADRDLFPGLAKVCSALQLDLIAPDTITQRVWFLFVMLLVSGVLAFITARVAREIKEKRARYPWMLSSFNFLLGVGLFGGYILTLVTKEK